MKRLKERFTLGGALTRREMCKLHKTWKWELEGYIATQDFEGNYLLTLR